LDEFSAHRDHLMAVAYRLLGTRSEAEDAVQEAWLRYASATGTGASGGSAEPAKIDDLRAWLTTVTTRICLDVLRSARVRREAYVGPWLPEPIVTRLPGGGPDPADEVAQADEVSLALLVVLEKLSPEQRAAFVLHDAFGVPFEEIAATLGTTPAAARQLASRARKAASDGTVRRTSDRAEQRRVLDAFLAASRRGDLDALLAVLAPDVVATGDGGGIGPAATKPIIGQLRVARFLLGLFRLADRTPDTVVELVRVNDDLGLLVDLVFPDGARLRGVICFVVADGQITAAYSQVNPNKLDRVPAADPARNLLA
jgi:RNA polymerase sigma-70 factor (ECF subfamily)